MYRHTVTVCIFVSSSIKWEIISTFTNSTTVRGPSQIHRHLYLGCCVSTYFIFNTFDNPSSSISQDVEFSSGSHPSKESVPLAISSTSRKLSLSSSGSSLSPSPSPSLSFHSSGPVGKASVAIQTYGWVRHVSISISVWI